MNSGLLRAWIYTKGQTKQGKDDDEQLTHALQIHSREGGQFETRTVKVLVRTCLSLVDGALGLVMVCVCRSLNRNRTSQ